MAKCPYCGQENPDNSQVCIECSRPLKKKRRRSRLLSGIGWIVGGVILIGAEFIWDLSLFGLLTTPWLFAALGAIAILKGIVDLFGGVADLLGRKEEKRSVPDPSE